MAYIAKNRILWATGLVLGAAFAFSAARAGDLVVSVRTANGQPLRDAVATVDNPGHAPAQHVDWSLRMAQENQQFNPFILVTPVGSEVSFPNHDAVRHHVYSFSPAKKFELKLFGKDETRKVTFDKVGVVALGCNIHDQMIAFIKVVDTPFAGKTAADGVVTLHNVPAGPVTLHVWHPYAKTPQNEVIVKLQSKETATRSDVVLDVRPGPGAMDMRGAHPGMR